MDAVTLASAVAASKKALVGKDALLYNITDHGAKMDGTTDDSAAINALIGTVPDGATIWVPSGRSVAAIALNRPHINICGPGTILGSITVGTNTATVDYNSRIEGLRILGPGAAVAGSAAISILAVSDLRVINCTIRDVETAIYIPPYLPTGYVANTQYTRRIKITHNEFGDVSYGFRQRTNALVTWQLVGDAYFTLNQFGANITGVLIDSIDGITIHANTFFVPGRSQLSTAKLRNIDIGTGWQSDWLVITDNELFEPGYESIALTNPRNLVIANNQIAWPGQRDLKDAIAITVTASGYARGIITGNNIQLFTKAAVGFYGTGDASGVTIGPNATLATNPNTFYYGSTPLPSSFTRYSSVNTLAGYPRITDPYNPVGQATSDFNSGATSDTAMRLGQRSILLSRGKVVAVTAPSTPIGNLSSATGSSATYGGMITMFVTGSGGTNVANYLLSVAGSAAGQSVTAVAANGETDGAVAATPAFTFAVNSSGALLATPVANTSGSFSFFVTTLGNLRFS